MANAVINPQLQDLGTGSTIALALEEYAGLVLTAFETANVVARYALKHNITEGASYQFPATWKMTAEEHTEGAELAGNNEPISEERTIAVDPKEVVAHCYMSTVQEFLSHFDTRAERAVQAARAIARYVDARALRVIINGARTAARSTFPAGQTLDTERGSTDVATVYPISLTGAKRLEDDMAEIAQKMDEDDVPRDMRIAFITPYLKRVLRQDNTLLSSDYQGPNDKLTRKVMMVEGFVLEETNLMPAETFTSQSNSNYDCACANTVCCMVGDASAFGQVSFGGIATEGPVWIPDKRSWLIDAAILQGLKWLRPEACGEIAITV